jgi:hypothetical protein
MLHNLMIVEPTCGPCGRIRRCKAVSTVEGELTKQNLTTNAVQLILNSTRATDIPNILKQLGDAQQDHLMAYLYKGMAAVGKAGGQGDASGSVLLNWHEKVCYHILRLLQTSNSVQQTVWCSLWRLWKAALYIRDTDGAVDRDCWRGLHRASHD